MRAGAVGFLRLELELTRRLDVDELPEAMRRIRGGLEGTGLAELVLADVSLRPDGGGYRPRAIIRRVLVADDDL
jgi:hypothetical protein